MQQIKHMLYVAEMTENPLGTLSLLFIFIFRMHVRDTITKKYFDITKQMTLETALIQRTKKY